jgi:hypothetical protein
LVRGVLEIGTAGGDGIRICTRSLIRPRVSLTARERLGHHHTREALTAPGYESGDRFGAAVAVADFNKDSGADIAAGVPGEPPGRQGARDRGQPRRRPAGPAERGNGADAAAPKMVSSC